jgi:hypothetical protein
MMSMLGRKTKTGLDLSMPTSTAIAATAVREYIRAVTVASRSGRGEPSRTRSSMDRASVFGMLTAMRYHDAKLSEYSCVAIT